MATPNEESTLEKVQRELEHYKAKKASSESLLNEELKKAKIEYDNLVEDIHLKYNVSEVSEDIKRHTYFLRLLNGEVPIPGDLNAKKTKVKKDSSVKSNRVTDWPGKITAALKKLKKTVADEPTTKEVREKIRELYPDITFKDTTFNPTWNDYKEKNK